MSKTDIFDIHPKDDPWGNFLNTRLRLISFLDVQGDLSVAEIAQTLDMNDLKQIELLIMTARHIRARADANEQHE